MAKGKSTKREITIELELTEREAEDLKEVLRTVHWGTGEGSLLEGVFDALDAAGVANLNDDAYWDEDLGIVLERAD